MERFVPRELTQLMGKEDLREVRAGDSRSQAMTVCFVDVRQFSQLVVREGSDRAFRLLNELFRDLGEVVHRHHGVVDKYLGDGSLILFPRAAADACEAALDMQRRCEALRQAAAPGQPELRIGVGLHCGEIIVGAVGHDARMDISVVSHVVNLTSRVQEVARNLSCDIVITDELVAQLPVERRQDLRPLLIHDLRGADQPHVLWECFHLLSESVRAERRRTREVLERATQLSSAGDWRGAAGVLEVIAEADDTCRKLRHWAAKQAAREAMP